MKSVIDAIVVRFFDFWLALIHPAVRRGLYGTGFLAISTFTPAYLPQNSPWWVLLRGFGLDGFFGKFLGTGCAIAGISLLISAWFALRPTIYREVPHWAILGWWSLPLLLVPPVFSHDAYSYAAQGWLWHNGLNPYEVGPGVLPGAFADQVAWVWRYTPAPYGPTSIMISKWLCELAGLDPYLSAVFQRFPALVGVLLIVVFLPRIAARLGIDPRLTAWFSTINPLFVIDFVGGAHNDALMMGLVIFGLWLAYQNFFWLAAVAIGVAATIKQPALLAAFSVALIGRPLSWSKPGRVLLRVTGSFAVAIGVFSAISVATGLNFGWYNAVNVPGMVVTLAPFSFIGWVIQQLLNLLAVDPSGTLAISVFRWLGLAISALILVYLALTKAVKRPVTFLSWGYLAVAIGGPALHTWYLTWGGLLLPLTKPSPRVINSAVFVTTVLLAYAAGNLAWRNDVVALTFAAAGLFFTLLWRYFGRKREGIDGG